MAAHFQKLLSNTPNVSDNEIEKEDSPLNMKLGNFICVLVTTTCFLNTNIQSSHAM